MNHSWERVGAVGSKPLFMCSLGGPFFGERKGTQNKIPRSSQDNPGTSPVKKIIIYVLEVFLKYLSKPVL